MGPLDPFDEAIQAQPPQVVRHQPAGNGFGPLPGERGETVGQVAMSETAGQVRIPMMVMGDSDRIVMGVSDAEYSLRSERSDADPIALQQGARLSAG